jgi:CHAT domain-containing protein
VSPSAVAAALPARTALVAFTLGADDALALVVRAEGLEARALDATAPRVSALVARLHRPLDDLRNGTTDLANLGFDARAAEELHALLFAPLEDLLAGCDALLVVPDGPLWRVPLAALVRRRVPTRVDARRLYAQHARHEYLGDRYALGVLPSAGLLVAPRPPRPAGEGALVVADPVPLPHDAARLAGAAREARGAATRLAGAQLLAGRDASEAVVRARLERAGWLHFAVHASLDALHPEASRLALAPGAGHDGWLHAFEVERLSLGAEHVVLSACEGAGPAVAGEGFLGLARAFLAAGAPSVVASHWVVEDAAGGAFMDAFYAARARGARPLAALSAAQRAQRHGGPARVSYAHPFFWAGYTHVGLP